MKVRKLIKTFSFRNQDRDDVVLGPGTRLDAEGHRATLLADAEGAYSTDPDLFVKSRLTNPKAVRRWIGFEANSVQVLDDLGQPITATRYRLDDGTSERFWDGSAWVLAGPSDWNTEAEIAGNVSLFDATATRQLRVVANLSTVESRFSPELIQIKVLYEAVIDFQEDILYRSLIPLLRASIRPLSRFIVTMPVTASTFQIADAALETGYNIVAIDSVFDLTNDADRLNDLFQSFDGTTITMTAPVQAGNTVFVRFFYEPLVAFRTSQDFVDAARVPALILDSVELVNARDAPSGEDSVANKAQGTAVLVPSPQQGDLEITLIGMADKGVDEQRLLEAVNAFFANTPFVRSTGLDEAYRLQLLDEYASVSESNQDEIHVGRARFQIRHFRRWLKEAQNEHIAQRIKTTTSSNLKL